MVTCSVSDCSVNHKKNPEKYTFHRFPQDPLIRGKWLKLIGRVGWSPTKNSTICSKHFIENFKRKSRINTILAKGAIPTLFVPRKERPTTMEFWSRLLKEVSSSDGLPDLRERVKLNKSFQQLSNPVSFINKKDYSSKNEGYLTYPSKDVIKLCLQVEKFIRQNKKITKGIINKSTINKATLIILKDNFNLFLCLTRHNLDQEILSGHRYLIH